MKPIRVLVVEDSPVVAELLRRIITADQRFLVVAVVGSGEEALTVIDKVNPDVISMDIHLPGMQGFEATRRIMMKRPTPIVIVSGSFGADIPISMRALQAGALAVVEKPRAATHEDYALIAGRLCTQLAIMSEVKVLRQREPQMFAAGPLPAFEHPPSPASTYRILGVAASTGGPNALVQLLCGLGDGFPLPIALVQHMAPPFLLGFAEWLESVTPFSVKVVDTPMTVESGRVYLAGRDCHLAVRGAAAYPDFSSPHGVHRPSANVLFSSLAQAFGSSAIGVVLTGMGEDGAVGLSELREAGAWTIAEDESTAIVNGMPAAAVRAGAVVERLPLQKIAPRVLAMVDSAHETARQA